MLDGVTPFPAEFAARYRALGYWQDRPLFDGFTAALAAYADRVALVDEAGPVTYRQLGERAEHLARVVLDHGFRPLDRIHRPVAEHRYLRLPVLRAAADRGRPGAGPARAPQAGNLQFAEISGARALTVPAAARGFDFTAMAAEASTRRPDLRLCLIQGLDEAPNDPRFVRWKTYWNASPGPAARRWTRSASTRTTRRCSCYLGARPGSPS